MTGSIVASNSEVFEEILERRVLCYVEKDGTSQFSKFGISNKSLHKNFLADDTKTMKNFLTSFTIAKSGMLLENFGTTRQKDPLRRSAIDY